MGTAWVATKSPDSLKDWRSVNNEYENFIPRRKKVNAIYKGFTVDTDQPKAEGGDGSTPEPYNLFLASIGTCAGIYVLYFCHERGIDTAALKMTVRFEIN